MSTTVCNQTDKIYQLAHQNVCITKIDFVEQKLQGFVELHFVPIKLKISRIRLNAKQCQITKLLAKGCHGYHSCNFTFNDPLLEVVPVEPIGEADVSSSERTLKKFNTKHQDAVFSTEADFGNGEIIVQLPDEVQKDISEGSTFRILIEYVIEDVQGGIHFVIPDEENDKTTTIDLTTGLPVDKKNDATESNESEKGATNESSSEQPRTNGMESSESPNRESETPDQTKNKQSLTVESPVQNKSVYAHVYTYKNHNSSRLWFPCIDTYGQLCTWILEFTVESHLTVVSCGDLIGTHSSPDRKTKTYKFELNIPTAAPNIGFAAGQFETWVDSASTVSSCPMKNYFFQGLERLAKASCSFLNECAEFYEDFLSFKYPYSNYKQVFVDQAYEPFQSYATLSICCTNLLHSRHIIDQTFVTRSVLSEALATQYFGCFIAMSTWASAWSTRGISSYMAAQYRRKVFGNNEFRFQVQETMKKLIDYEQKFGGIVLDETSHVVNKSRNTFHFSTQSPHTISPFFDEAHKSKSFLVIRMLEDRIGKLLLVQVFNKILSLASNASQQPVSTNMWSNMLLSTSSFERAVFTVTGKDKEIA